MLGKGRVDPGESLCLEWLRQIDPEDLGSQRCAEGAKLRCLCHGRSSAVDDELQPHQVHTAWSMMSSLSRSGNQGSSSVNIVTHYRPGARHLGDVGSPEHARRSEGLGLLNDLFYGRSYIAAPAESSIPFLLDEKSAVVPVRLIHDFSRYSGIKRLRHIEAEHGLLIASLL